jgi:hypothetical protein
MTGVVTGGILRAAVRNAITASNRRADGLWRWLLVPVAVLWMIPGTMAQKASEPIPEITEMKGIAWNFGQSTDRNFDDWPDGWQRVTGIGYPSYVKVKITARDREMKEAYRYLDRSFVRLWPTLREYFPSLSVSPPSLPEYLVDQLVDRYLRIDLDGGQVKIRTSRVAVSRLYQYRFSCEIMTQGLRHDTARAELVFLDKSGNEIAAHATERYGGSTDPEWTTATVTRLQPPPGAVAALVRLIVQRAEDGLEDIHGTIGFDNLRIDQYPQLQLATDQPLGVYELGQPIEVTARVMGLPIGASRVRFRLFDSEGREIDSRLASVVLPQPITGDSSSVTNELTWRLPSLSEGFYRVGAAMEGNRARSLSTEATLAVIDRLVAGPPHGSFGWTLPAGHEGIEPRHLAPWLAKLGVAWVKYPCWIAPDDNDSAELIATVFSKLQDADIQTVGMLDIPPDDQLSQYDERGRRDLVAAQLFRESSTWQPLLEPVMTRLTLKVRTWQLGADRDHSFLGRPLLRESIKEISTGLQGFGQPIDVAISWPWLESQLGRGEASWQAVCRSSDPPLGADELDAFLGMDESGSRGDAPRTWLLLDPVSRSQYQRDARIRDLVLRMATVRGHRVQAAFVSNPRDPDHGLLRADGRPDELLLPWRTTSRLIGNLRHVGRLQLLSGAPNAVFADNERAVMMVWSAEPTEELIYLGDDVRSVDVWGRAEQLPLEEHDGEWVQRIKIGSLPTFLVGVDPALLAFRMSVELDRRNIDSLLGQVQRMSVTFVNPTREGLVGELQVSPPEAWRIESPRRSWEALGGRSDTKSFDVVLGNSAKIGTYEVPIRFEIQSVPPKRITVYRRVDVGPEGLELKVDTRLTPQGPLRVQIEMTNSSDRVQSYDCMLFPDATRQYQRRFITIEPRQTVRNEIYWADGADLVGGKMLLRAVEQDGRRVVNYEIDVTR